MLPLFYLLLPVNIDLLLSSLARKTYNSFPHGLVLCSCSSYGHSPARLFSPHPRSDALSISWVQHMGPPQPTGMLKSDGGE